MIASNGVDIYSVFIILVLFISGAAPTVLHSQLRSAIGVVGNFNFNLHRADFRAFPGVPSCCPAYEGGSGSGLTLGVLYEVPLAEQLRLAIRGVYSSQSGTLTRTESATLAGNVPGIFEHRVESSLANVGIEPWMQYNVVSRLWVGIGVRAAFVTSSNFSQTEVITEPSTGTFANGMRSRNVVPTQGIPDANRISAGLVAGVSLDVPLNRDATLLLAPELTYCYSVTSVVRGIDWSVDQLRFGASIKWSPLLAGFTRGTEKVTRDDIQSDDVVLGLETKGRTDTIRVARKEELSNLVVAITASALEAEGMEGPIVNLRVEEFLSVLMTPLLPYIFFDENSSIIPTRYIQLGLDETAGFEEKKINRVDRLFTYHHILSVIGKRMIENPTSTITLVGCNADNGDEKGNLLLSEQRAKAIKRHFTTHWGVAADRIAIEVRNLPEKASLTKAEEGYQENRRVEIRSHNPVITKPLITDDTLRVSNPPAIRFRFNVKADVKIVSWRVVAEQHGTVIRSFEGTGHIPTEIDWNMDKEGTQPRADAPLKYTLYAIDASGRTASASDSIPIEQITIRRKKIERRDDKLINRFSLILFEVRSSEIKSVNKQLIELIKKSISPSSSVSVSGYTDRLGDASANQALAESRAKATAKALGVETESVGHGEPHAGARRGAMIFSRGNADTFNPGLPEGRLYTRTVDVVVETPIK